MGVPAERATIMPPRNDLDSPVSAVEVLRWVGDLGDAVSLRIELDEEDVERIQRGERVWWLTWNSPILVPFSMEWPDPVEPAAPKEGDVRLTGCTCGQGDDALAHKMHCLARADRWVNGRWVCIDGPGQPRTTKETHDPEG